MKSNLTQTDWFWIISIIITFFATLGITQIVQYVYRQFKLKRPIESHFLIPRNDLFILNYVQQNNIEHHVNKLILPSGSNCCVILWNKPKIDFQDTQIQFACDGDYNTRPRAIIWYNPYVKKGKTKKIKPEDNNKHYIDWWNNYHIEKTQYRNRDTVYMTGFLVKTNTSGIYNFKTYYHTPTKGGKSELIIEVRDPPFNIEVPCLKYKQEKRHYGKYKIFKINKNFHVKIILIKFLDIINRVIDTKSFFINIYKKFDFSYHLEHNIIFKKDE